MYSQKSNNKLSYHSMTCVCTTGMFMRSLQVLRPLTLETAELLIREQTEMHALFVNMLSIIYI